LKQGFNSTLTIAFTVESTNDFTMGMSLTEASRLVRLGPRDPELRLEELYPDLTTVERRREAWLEDNRDSIKEAMTLFISARPEML
jgi:hypothetical protein